MDYHQFIISTIKKAGEILLANYQQNQTISIKEGDIRNIVTETDFKINKFLIKEIKNHCPEHGIYSEETGSDSLSNKNLWTIDPIDGTANFARRIPHFAITIGLLQNGQPILGAVYNPITKELYSFEKGKGAFLNGTPIHVSNVAVLDDACVFMTSGRKPGTQEWGSQLYLNLLKRANKTRNFAGSALDLCFVAAGKIEGTVYGTLTTMDVASAIGILAEAGGMITDGNGNPLPLSVLPQRCVVSNGKIHAELLSVIPF